jgi:phosphoadenosine phosphosulfate reductase
LGDWTKDDLEAYFALHDLPRHPLEAQGYLSVGCAPCTSVVKPGEDPRAGRWRGWDKTECGIHSPVSTPDGAAVDVPTELPPGYEPFL